MKRRILFGLGILGVLGLEGLISGCQNHSDAKREYYELADSEYRNAEPDSATDLERISDYGIMIIDMQEEFLGKISPEERDRIVRSQLKLLRVAAENRIPVMIFEYKPGMVGRTIPELREAIERVPIKRYFDKEHDDGFESYSQDESEDTPEAWLRRRNVRNIVFSGVNTGSCVWGTASTANDYYRFGIITSLDLLATEVCEGYCKEVAPALNFFRNNGVLLEDSSVIREYLARG
jgi:hypothetical protein